MELTKGRGELRQSGGRPMVVADAQRMLQRPDQPGLARQPNAQFREASLGRKVDEFGDARQRNLAMSRACGIWLIV